MHELRVIPIRLELDFPILKSWWEKRDFPPPNPRFLPPIGKLVLSGEKPICGGFLFRSDAGAAIIGHLVSNPHAPGAIRNAGLDALIESLTQEGRKQGFEMICCSTNLPRLMERFERHGLTKTDDGVANFGRVLCQ